MHSLQLQYNHIIDRFNFGQYDPLCQATVFRQKATEFLSKDFSSGSEEKVLLLSQENSFDQIEHIGAFLSNLWRILH